MLDGIDGGNTGVMLLRDGSIRGGDAFLVITTESGPGAPAPSTSARCATSIAPLASVCTSSRQAVPKPSSRSERSMVACRSALATTRTVGAPARPSRSTSQPCSASTWCRPATSPTVFASCAPVTNPVDAEAGIPSSSLAQAPATCSAAIAAGDRVALNAHWSQPAASTSAAVAAGVEPPMTNPK